MPAIAGRAMCEPDDKYFTYVGFASPKRCLAGELARRSRGPSVRRLTRRIPGSPQTAPASASRGMPGSPAPSERDIVLHLRPIRRVAGRLLPVGAVGPVDHAGALVGLVELPLPLLHHPAVAVFLFGVRGRRRLAGGEAVLPLLAFDVVVFLVRVQLVQR